MSDYFITILALLIVLSMFGGLFFLILKLVRILNLQKILNVENKKLPQNIQSGLSFPNAITKEEYYKRKDAREKKALSDTRFWDKLEVDIFSKNIEYCEKGICPYCSEKLPERKGKSYKCPSCKGKIYRKREILTDNEGLFTADEREILNNLWEEFQNRKSFLELWEKANNIMTITLDENKKYDIKTAAQQAMMLLRLGKPEFYKNNRKSLINLRNCRMIEGEFQRRFGTIQQATNIYMQILYLDLLDDFETCSSNACLDCDDIDIDDNGKFIISKDKKKIITEQAIKKFEEKKVCLAPAIYSWAFEEDLPIEEFEKIFKFNANNLNETFKGKLPIIPDDAWEKIEEYRKLEANKK